LGDFAHAEVEVAGVALFQGDVVQYALGQVGADQLAGYELHPEEGAFGKGEVGEVAILETDIREVGGFQLATAETDVAEGAVGDASMGAVDIFLFVSAETESADGLFGFQPLFQALGAFSLSFQSGRDDSQGRHGEGSFGFHGVDVSRDL